MNYRNNALRVFTLALYVMALAIVPTPKQLRADECYELLICNDGMCVSQWMCGPEYYAWQYTEPDWDLYAHGDEVETRHDAQWNIIAWYVTPASDPGRDGNYVVMCYNGRCELFQYMW